MKKLISVTLLSAVAMLASATTPAPKAQNTTAPTTTPSTTKKAHKKHVSKTKAAAKPVAATATPSAK